MIDVNSAPVWMTAITVIGGIITLLVQGLLASKERASARVKLDEIKHSTNSGLTEVKAELATARALIMEMKNQQIQARIPVSPPLPQSLPPASPELTRPTLVRAATAAGVAAAEAVAGAAVEKKDEIAAKLLK